MKLHKRLLTNGAQGIVAQIRIGVETSFELQLHFLVHLKKRFCKEHPAKRNRVTTRLTYDNGSIAKPFYFFETQTGDVGRWRDCK